jgi:mRNA interferase MazF
MDIKRGYVYIIDFNPQIKTKPGKLRPGLVLQSDLVTEAGYPSTIVVPATTQLIDDPGILRLRVTKGQAGLKQDSDLLLGQLIAVSNESFRQELKLFPVHLMDDVITRIRIILSL